MRGHLDPEYCFGIGDMDLVTRHKKETERSEIAVNGLQLLLGLYYLFTEDYCVCYIPIYVYNIKVECPKMYCQELQVYAFPTKMGLFCYLIDI